MGPTRAGGAPAGKTDGAGPKHRRGQRRERGIAAEREREAARGPASRAQTLAEIAAMVEGSEEAAPVPLAIAARAAGVRPETVVSWLERGEAPGLEQARARGHVRAIRRACGEGPDARQWAWLAERLAPRELHLPTRVTGVAPEDGGAPIATATLAVTIVEARALARDDDGPVALPAETRRR